MGNFYIVLLLLVMACIAAFSIGWSLKTGSASPRYLIGRDYRRDEDAFGYWSVVGGNTIILAALVFSATYVALNPPAP